MKVLWERRLVPDNYVDDSFLSQLKRNHNVVGYKPSTLVVDASVLLINLTVALNFVLSFVAIYRRNLDPRWQLGLATVLDLALIGKWLSHNTTTNKLIAFKSVLATVVAVVSLTPVFRSLTESTSSDSIWAITGWLLLVNVAVSSRSFPVLSINTALAATIVLASRLHDSLSVFYFIMSNIESFVTLPTVYKWLRLHDEGHDWAWGLLAFVSVCSWVMCWWILGGFLLSLWISLQILILCGVPQLFLSLQRYKDRISGPWDMARPILN